MKKSVHYVILIIASVNFHSAAIAATTTAVMTNTVTITNNCSISTLGFTTTYDPIVANASIHQDVTASVTTICTNGANPVTTLGQGANPDSGSTDSIPLRRLSSGGATPVYLNYLLFSDSGRTAAWGNTPATAPVAINGSGSASAVTIYARVPSGQVWAKAGIYSDTVVATVTF